MRFQNLCRRAVYVGQAAGGRGGWGGGLSLWLRLVLLLLLLLWRSQLRALHPMLRILQLGHSSSATTRAHAAQQRNATFQLTFFVLGLCGALVAIEPFADEVHACGQKVRCLCPSCCC